MIDTQRFKLHGAYQTPRVRVGRILVCEYRDCEVIVTGYRNGRIPWPKGRRRDAAAVGLVLFGALAEAVWRESNLGVCYWFGVTAATVSKWRRALGVAANNAGTGQLRQAHAAQEWFTQARSKAQATPWTEERRQEVGDRSRGIKRAPHVVEAMRKGRVGKPHTEEARAKMRVAWAARGPVYATNGRAWTADEDEVVRTLPAPVAASRLSRTIGSVYNRRVKLTVPDGRAANGRRKPV